MLRRSKTRIWLFFIILNGGVLLFSTVNAYANPEQASIVGPAHYISGFPARTADGMVNAVIEITAGTNEKWEVDAVSGILEPVMKKGQRRVVQYLGYPGNYGMIPGTILPKTSGGDGDPLDALVIGAPVRAGSVVPVKIIGVLKFLDKGEIDDKLLAVLPDSPFANVDSLEQLQQSFPGVLDIIKTWFLYYKGSGKMIFKGTGDQTRAEDILEQAIKHYQNAEIETAASDTNSKL